MFAIRVASFDAYSGFNVYSSRGFSINNTPGYTVFDKCREHDISKCSTIVHTGPTEQRHHNNKTARVSTSINNSSRHSQGHPFLILSSRPICWLYLRSCSSIGSTVTTTVSSCPAGSGSSSSLSTVSLLEASSATPTMVLIPITVIPSGVAVSQKNTTVSPASAPPKFTGSASTVGVSFAVMVAVAIAAVVATFL
jgi:hypothetical protein